MHRYNFPTINAIDILFSPLHTTPFLYSKMHFGVLDYIRADVPTCDTPWGSKLPYLRVGVIKSLQIRFVVERSYIYLFVLFVNFYAIRYGDTVEQTTCTFSRSFRANDLISLIDWWFGQIALRSMYGEAGIITLARIKHNNNIIRYRIFVLQYCYLLTSFLHFFTHCNLTDLSLHITIICLHTVMYLVDH